MNCLQSISHSIIWLCWRFLQQNWKIMSWYLWLLIRWRWNCDLQFEILRLLAFSFPHIHYHKLEILHLLLEQREQYASCAGGRCYTIQLHLILLQHQLRHDQPVDVRCSTHDLQKTIKTAIEKTLNRLPMQAQTLHWIQRQLLMNIIWWAICRRSSSIRISGFGIVA